MTFQCQPFASPPPHPYSREAVDGQMLCVYPRMLSHVSLCVSVLCMCRSLTFHQINPLTRSTPPGLHIRSAGLFSVLSVWVRPMKLPSHTSHSSAPLDTKAVAGSAQAYTIGLPSLARNMLCSDSGQWYAGFWPPIVPLAKKEIYSMGRFLATKSMVLFIILFCPFPGTCIYETMAILPTRSTRCKLQAT